MNTSKASTVNANTRRLHKLGQSLWLDNITRDILDSGQLQRYCQEFSLTGLTSNPTIFDQAIRKGQAYDEDIRSKSAEGGSADSIFFELAIADLKRAAALFLPAHQASDSMDGWVSLEVSPLLAYDARSSVAEATRLHAQANCPNLFIKIPGTPEGLHAIEDSIYAGIPVNVTLLFSCEQYVAAADAYCRGIRRRIEAGLDPKVHSVASLFISRWDKAVAQTAPEALRNRLGVAVAGRTYRSYVQRMASPEWARLAAAGAVPQRLLWASTGVKDPALPETYYVEALAAPETINTMPDKTLHAYADSGQLRGEMARDGVEAETQLAEFARAGVDVAALALRLQQEGAQAFEKSWNDLMNLIAQKGGTAQPGTAPEGSAS
ncbi:transaldolase [Candidimonas nitroreducens]|uniref:Transaldolase n=1 Tax=Candidimonas nitroreducens TaxID=683354 RepID=A0A225MYE8_9BURK|nr:transaldolase [Candidimonas nitroreducens]OWT66417.1 transaldolase [Candidimonas nitroreducens]